uniref:PSI-J n=1 Tax=Alexandrium monilatum TaxID=311494 RepID=A0A7S4PWT0_9DINO
MIHFAAAFTAAVAALALTAEAASVSQPTTALRAPPQALANASKEDPWFDRTLQQIGAALSESPLSTGASVARRLLGTPQGKMTHLEASLLSLGAHLEQEPPRSVEHHKRRHRVHHRGVSGRATTNPELAGHMFGGLPWVFICPVISGLASVFIVHVVSLWSEFFHPGKAGFPGEVTDET